jgi:surfactin synthase thioesterase subunit/NADPH:quinone reductase-like Zn-dependent oxidoreductase/NAD(P)-dependent dehydrogenase (short-subunit alcohol dehydrogenase family)/aryl carrier-like protein
VLDALQSAVAANEPVTVLTAGAVGDHPVAPEQAAIWGLARSVGNEHPELTLRLIDVDRETSSAQLDAELEHAGPRELALVAGRRLVPRLRRGAAPSRSARAAALFPADTGLISEATWRAVDVPEPGPDEVTLDVVHMPIGFMDVMRAAGLDATPGTGPLPLGLDFTGQVVRVGEAVTHVAPGDAVWGVAPAGVRTRMTVSASLVARTPSCATSPMALVAAHHLLERCAQLAAEQVVVVHSATGALGDAAVQWARLRGARVIVTAGDAERRARLMAAGHRWVLDSRSLDFAKRVRGAFPHGVDVVLCSLTADAAAQSRALVRDGGVFLDLDRRRIPPRRPASVAPIREVRFDWHAWLRARPEQAHESLVATTKAVARGALRPPNETVVPTDGWPVAANRMLQARHDTKPVLAVGDLDVKGAPASVEVTATEALALPAGAFLVTGGLGALGQRIARWLLDNGAPHVVLLGRTERPLSGELSLASEKLSVAIGDAARREDVRVAVQTARARGGRLGGVFHVAGVRVDRTAMHLDEEALAAALEAKVDGARLLDEAAGDAPWFVAFSSVAILGTPGQGAYAAANAGLEAICRARRARGRHALAVAWGAWAGEGMADAQEVAQRMRRAGLRGLEPDVALEALGRLLVADAGHAIVADADWELVARYLPATASAHMFDEVATVEDEGAASWLRVLRSTPSGARAAWLARAIGGVVEVALGETVADDLSLVELGVDSLLALELRNRLQRELGIALDVRDLLRSPTVLDVASNALSAMDLPGGPSSPAAEQPHRRRLLVGGHEAPAVIAFPFAGAGPHVLAPLTRQLDMGVATAQYAGRAERGGELPLTSIAAIADELVSDVVAASPRVLFGHCMGALVMFELARALRRRGCAVPELVVSACPAPQTYLIPALHPGTRRFVEERPTLRNRLMPVPALDDEQLLEVLRFLGFERSAELMTHAELRRAALPVIRADFAACAAYRYRSESPLPARITVLVGTDDPFARPERAEEWGAQSGEPIEVIEVPGDHYFVTATPGPVIGAIERALARRRRPLGGEGRAVEILRER